MSKQNTFAEMSGIIAVVDNVKVCDIIKANQKYLDKNDDHGYPISGDAITRTKAAN